MLRESKSSIAKERADLQELISDISHQVKTPIANLKMLDATLLEQTVSPEKQKEFLLAMDSQLDKLDFLMQAMIKTSRLEAGVIALEPKPQAIYDTLAAALGGILLNAEQKKIVVTVDCPETVTAAHDRKWTTEALFNILDNAVKYTPEGGKIHVAVVCWEMYVKIDISDTGIVFQNNIKERFSSGSTVRTGYMTHPVLELVYILPVRLSPGKGALSVLLRKSAPAPPFRCSCPILEMSQDCDISRRFKGKFKNRRDISARISLYNGTIKKKGGRTYAYFTDNRFEKILWGRAEYYKGSGRRFSFH